MPRHDLDLKGSGPDAWRKYLGVLFPGTLWSFKKRGLGGSASYPGNFVPEIARQILPRYSKKGDLICDLFAGSETTADVCGELDRIYVGCDLRPRSLRTDAGDARTYDPGIPAQVVFLHPPYADIIDYNERLGGQPGDLSLRPDHFLTEFKQVAANAFKICETEGYAVLVIGDMFEDGHYIPLGFKTMQVMLDAGFTLNAIHVKDFGNEVANKGKNANLYFFRGLKNAQPVLEHEYVFILQKPKPKRTRS